MSAVVHNYEPLPVTLATGEGAWVEDVDGRRYLDALAGYSALNFGHRHPRLVEATRRQLDRITLTSRAFGSDQLQPFCTELAELAGKDLVLPMNTGAEAVETAIKTARRWGYQAKGVPEDDANIVVMDANFHGRTTTIVSFSTDDSAREDFGPFTPGFRTVAYDDLPALRDAVDANTVAVLLEPVQGEAGVIIPSPDFLPGVRALCDEREILMIADEIQSGLCRTGTTFACDRAEVVPDLYLLGKALGGGIVPISAVVGDADVLGVFTPGSHGSTFGGNPLACAIGREVVAMVGEGEWQRLATERGETLGRMLGPLVGRGVTAVRRIGLWAGVDLDPDRYDGHDVCLALMQRGVLARETHGSTIRLAPPLLITDEEIDLIGEALGAVLAAG